MKQQLIPVLGDVKRQVKSLPPNQIRLCEDETDAKNLTINQIRMKDYMFADLLNRNPGNFSKMRQGIAAFPPNSDEKIMRLAGNIGYLQYLAGRFNFKLVPMSESEIRETTREEVEELKEQNAMLKHQLTGNW